MKNKSFIIYSTLFLMFIFTISAFANKSSVKIDAPDSAKNGEIITIKITVSHSANNFFHHTNWVYVKVNGKEIARWDFSASDRPETEVFTKEVSFKVENSVTIEAEANCNVHGSAGKAEKKIDVK
jgi:desulfoferrodoxin (superoxide reductase-like protein)